MKRCAVLDFLRRATSDCACTRPLTSRFLSGELRTSCEAIKTPSPRSFAVFRLLAHAQVPLQNRVRVRALPEMVLGQLDPILISRTTWVPLISAGITYDFRWPAKVTQADIESPSTSILFKQATPTPTYFIRISFDPFPKLHYDIDVESHSSSIAVKDVLTALHVFFQRPLTRQDIMSMTEGQRVQVDNAFYRRAGPAGVNSLVFNAGYKHIDLLLGDTTFRGLQPTASDLLPQLRLVLIRDWVGRVFETQNEPHRYTPREFLTYPVRTFLLLPSDLTGLYVDYINKPISYQVRGPFSIYGKHTWKLETNPPASGPHVMHPSYPSTSAGLLTGQSLTNNHPSFLTSREGLSVGQSVAASTTFSNSPQSQPSGDPSSEYAYGPSTQGLSNQPLMGPGQAPASMIPGQTTAAVNYTLPIIRSRQPPEQVYPPWASPSSPLFQ